MKIHELKKESHKRDKKRIARGGARGKTAGRGTKGQKSRAGTRIRPAFRDVFQKIPKKRGYNKNRGRTLRRRFVPRIEISVGALNNIDGNLINPRTLLKSGVIKKQRGMLPNVKLLGRGDVKKSFSVYNCFVSETAKEKIEKAGGKVNI